MRTMKYFLVLFAVLLCFSSCEKDEYKLYLSSIGQSELIASESFVVLTQQNSQDIVLSLAWTKDALQISDPSLSAIDVTIQTLQASLQADFSDAVSQSVETSVSKAYTGFDLNTLAKNIGAVPDVANTVYFRLAAQTGQNMTPVYSNTVTVSITPYTIDMSLGYILDSSMAATGVTLYSPNSDGDYTGFMGATSWYNYYLQEGDGTIWGNDGVVGTAFTLSSEDDADKRWNFWFPGLSGCYYVDVNTNTQLWSALYIPSLNVDGGIEGTMTFDRPNVKWTLVFNAEQTGTVNLKIAGTGRLYDVNTGTDGSDGDTNLGIETAVAFVSDGGKLALGTEPGEISVNIPALGECTLVLDLSNPSQWTASVVSGGVEAETISEVVYLPGISDGDGSWTFNNSLYLYDEDNLSYAGCADVNSPWGYQVAIEKDNWDDVYKMVDGDAYMGSLGFKEGENIVAPGSGLYLINISLKNLTYALTEVGNEIYYSGFNDDWNLYPMTPVAGTAGLYTASVVVTADTPWGFQIVLDGNWTNAFGGKDGRLLYQGSSAVSNIPFDLPYGTYTLTVDLINSTYTIE